MSKILINTYAFNAETTIRRTIESILNQTYSDFIYYVVDNGSTDGTGNVIREYAAKDSRIVPLANQKNNVWEKGNSSYAISLNAQDDDYFVNIDADDEYLPEFLEKMLAFIECENLDIAVCGNYLIDAVKGTVTNAKKLNQNLILEGDGFGTHLPQYYQFMRTIWGKVYKIPIVRKLLPKRYKEVSYAGDTLYVLTALQRANRVGILSEPLHKYYLSPVSRSYQLDDKRIASDRVLFDAAREFLITKCGDVSRENEHFLYAVYYHAIIDTLKVVTGADVPLLRKLDAVNGIFSHELTKNAISDNTNPYIKKFAINDDVSDWIRTLTNSSPLLSGFDMDTVLYLRNAVALLLDNDLPATLDALTELVSGSNVPDEYAESLVTLGLNVAAALFGRYDQCADEFKQEFIARVRATFVDDDKLYYHIGKLPDVTQRWMSEHFGELLSSKTLRQFTGTYPVRLPSFVCMQNNFATLFGSESLLHQFTNNNPMQFHSFVINLPSRNDRRESFTGTFNAAREAAGEAWRFGEIEVCSAYDGSKIRQPKWFTAGDRPYACFRSHQHVLLHAVSNDLFPCIIFEDDAVFPVNFAELFDNFLRAVPDDWEMLYIGGQHTKTPTYANGYVIAARVNRLHAYLIRDAKTANVILDWLEEKWIDGNHVDHHMERLHESGQLKVYAPEKWFVLQSEGQSDICGTRLGARSWNPGEPEVKRRSIKTGGVLFTEYAIVYGEIGLNGSIGADSARISDSLMSQGKCVGLNSPSYALFENNEPVSLVVAINETSPTVNETVSIILDGTEVATLNNPSEQTAPITIEQGIHKLEITFPVRDITTHAHCVLVLGKV